MRKRGFLAQGLRQHVLYMGQVASRRASWPAVAMDSWRPQHDATARHLRGVVGRPPEHMAAESASEAFVMARAARQGEQRLRIGAQRRRTEPNGSRPHARSRRTQKEYTASLSVVPGAMWTAPPLARRRADDDCHCVAY